MKGIITAVNISKKKGVTKQNIKKSHINELGLEGDAHSGKWHRQISLLAEESINKMRDLGLDVSYGDFAENITTKGVSLHTLPVGTIFKINDVVLELTQIGKECHADCAIMQKTGKCIMPKEGIFARVIKTGDIQVGDTIEINAK